MINKKSGENLNENFLDKALICFHEFINEKIIYYNENSDEYQQLMIMVYSITSQDTFDSCLRAISYSKFKYDTLETVIDPNKLISNITSYFNSNILSSLENSEIQNNTHSKNRKSNSFNIDYYSYIVIGVQLAKLWVYFYKQFIFSRFFSSSTHSTSSVNIPLIYFHSIESFIKSSQKVLDYLVSISSIKNELESKDHNESSQNMPNNSIHLCISSLLCRFLIDIIYNYLDMVSQINTLFKEQYKLSPNVISFKRHIPNIVKKFVYYLYYMMKNSESVLLINNTLSGVFQLFSLPYWTENVLSLNQVQEKALWYMISNSRTDLQCNMIALIFCRYITLPCKQKNILDDYTCVNGSLSSHFLENALSKLSNMINSGLDQLFQSSYPVESTMNDVQKIRHFFILYKILIENVFLTSPFSTILSNFNSKISSSYRETIHIPFKMLLNNVIDITYNISECIRRIIDLYLLYCSLDSVEGFRIDYESQLPVFKESLFKLKALEELFIVSTQCFISLVSILPKGEVLLRIKYFVKLLSFFFPNITSPNMTLDPLTVLNSSICQLRYGKYFKDIIILLINQCSPIFIKPHRLKVILQSLILTLNLRVSNYKIFENYFQVNSNVMASDINCSETYNYKNIFILFNFMSELAFTEVKSILHNLSFFKNQSSLILTSLPLLYIGHVENIFDILSLFFNQYSSHITDLLLRTQLDECLMKNLYLIIEHLQRYSKSYMDPQNVSLYFKICSYSTENINNILQLILPLLKLLDICLLSKLDVHPLVLQLVYNLIIKLNYIFDQSQYIFQNGDCQYNFTESFNYIVEVRIKVQSKLAYLNHHKDIPLDWNFVKEHLMLYLNSYNKNLERFSSQISGDEEMVESDKIYKQIYESSLENNSPRSDFVNAYYTENDSAVTQNLGHHSLDESNDVSILECISNIVNSTIENVQSNTSVSCDSDGAYNMKSFLNTNIFDIYQSTKLNEENSQKPLYAYEESSHNMNNEDTLIDESPIAKQSISHHTSLQIPEEKLLNNPQNNSLDNMTPNLELISKLNTLTNYSEHTHSCTIAEDDEFLNDIGL